MKEPEITEELIREHGLTEEEYEKILDILGRKPTFTELGIFSVMWSEHCSYKSSRIHFRHFPTEAPWVIQGPGENAGVIDIGDGLAAVFKMESHNHPSYIEPYQGAATGVGGILRDIFTMGARPVASLNSLRFGDPKDPYQKHLFHGVVGGIAGYGNCIGVPTVGGEIYFHTCYNGNILVNVFNLGIAKKDRIFRGRAEGIGNPVIYVGSKTGRDGIHGVTMASEEFTDDAQQKKPNVQVGDPFTEKLLLEACLEAMSKDLIAGIQDMGGAGLSSSSSEMAGRAGTGIELELEKVPLREEGMIPYEIMLSESQERMLIVAKAGKEKELLDIFKKWDLDAVIIGKVTDDGMLRVKWHGKVVAEIPAKKISEDAPKYDRPRKRPAWQDELQQLNLEHIPIPKEFNSVLLKLLSSPSIASKELVWEQYDHMVRTNTVVRPGADSAVIRIKGTSKAIAISVDCNSRYCYLDPYRGAMLAVAEAARNVACSGARPLAITDNLNFGNPEKPEVMWQFVESIKGIAEACRVLETPVVSGNVSFYNETKGSAIYPTPTIAMVGILEDVKKARNIGFKEGLEVFLLGDTYNELGGSEYLYLIHGIERGLPPVIDLEKEKRLIRLLEKLVKLDVIHSCHDCSEGGLSVCIAESAIYGNTGAEIDLSIILKNNTLRPDSLLFGESSGRAVVTVHRSKSRELIQMADEYGISCQLIGRTGGDRLLLKGYIDLSISEISNSYKNSLKELFG
ncbi:MAG: phosphoribosylformylglycinamidine synthase subunit PurL [Thermodesulfovibrionales bacterium]|nr:phosphoribosylformylglycinamidine synthase subunit PurL [Thermodesulfovibrionales bacterium]